MSSLISLDVISLFTNVPINMAIKSLKKRWYHIKNNTNIPKKAFLSAVSFVLSSTVFLFNNRFYKQTYGTDPPIGSPISPIISDIIMQDLETEALKNLDFSLHFYFRYVDVIMAVSTNKINTVLQSFNSFHKRLKFTVELENNGCLNFLDTTIIREKNFLVYDWYRKLTFSGRYLHFNSHHPLNKKIATIIGLADRALLPSVLRKKSTTIFDNWDSIK